MISERGSHFALDLDSASLITATLDVTVALIPISGADCQRAVNEVLAFYRPTRLRARRIAVDTNALRITLDGFIRAQTRDDSVGVEPSSA